MTSQPAGFERNRTQRTVLRVLGVVLLLAGLYLVITGGMHFADDMNSASVDSGPGPILRLGAGGFLVVFGLGALNAGFLGAQARYAAGETMPVVKDSASYLSDGQGVMGVGRTVDDAPAPATKTGPYCSKCGVRNDADAKFCDSCGSSL
jgi:zinc-ribbon domain